MKNALLITFILLMPLISRAQTKPVEVPPELEKIEIPGDSVKSTRPDILSNAFITEDSNMLEIKRREGEHEPAFPGGIDAFYTYLTTNIRKIPLINHVKGEIITQFVINADGHVVEPKIVSGEVPEDIKQQIFKVFLNSPTWSPPIQNYRAVRVMYTMPLTF